MAGFDWPALMRLGLHRLQMAPAEFWALTPGELRLMLGETTGRRPLDRARLEALAAAFPDRPEKTGDRDG